MKPSIPFGLAAIALAAASAVATAQQVADVIIHDANNDQMVILTDLDGDGQYKSMKEQRTLALGGPAPDGWEPFDSEMRVEGGRFACYWVESDRPFREGCPPWDSRLLRGVDLDMDGTFTGAEITLYRNIAGMDGPALTQGIALTPDGSVWFTSDIFIKPSTPCGVPGVPAGWVSGIRRLRDLNMDGDANDPGESVTMLDGSAGGTFTFQTNSGPQSLSADAFRQMVAYADGVVAFNNFDSSSLFHFHDLNNDGDVTDPSEAILYLNPTGQAAGLDVNPDFAAAVAGSDPRSLVLPPCPPKATGNDYAWIEHITARVENNQTVVYSASGSSSLSCFSTNIFGEKINGLVFRSEDMNGDGDANDAGETKTFYNGSNLGSGPLLLDKILGLSVHNEWLYIGEYNPAKGMSVHRLRDLNGDGDAMDAGEQDTDLWVSGQDALDPPFPCYPVPTPPMGCTTFVNTITAHPPSAFSACSSCTTFCTSKPGLACGAAAITSTGSPSAVRASGFIIEAGPARTCRSGLLMYNTSMGAGLPFQGGTLCVAPAGIRRAGSTSSMGTPGGANCDGRFSIDMNTFAQGAWVVPDCAGNPSAIPPNNQAAFLSTPGQSVFTQFWGRDSVATGSFVSDGLGYVVGP